MPARRVRLSNAVCSLRMPCFVFFVAFCSNSHFDFQKRRSRTLAR